jgi:hypothetical protein
MTGETVRFETDAEDRLDAKRQQSSILFPYLDLDAGMAVAHHIYDAVGHGSLESHELAAQMKQTISGAFRLKTGTARIFELTEKDGRDGTKLSELGRQIISPETEKAARAEAFMRVPLYAAIYDKYKGQRLPPMKALEREMQALGVSSKQTSKARQAFERSARQAGYFEHGDDRLVRPRAELGGSVEDKGREQDQEDEADTGKRKKRGGGDDGGEDLHPFIRGLLDTLPPPDTDWTVAARADWLQTAASIFKLIYKGEGSIEVSAKPNRISGPSGPQTE